MHSSIKHFTDDIEFRLDKAYKGGASNKFGIEDIVQETSRSTSSISKSATKEDSKIKSGPVSRG